MFVKPAPGLKIKCPILLDVLPPEGREVEATDYWQRAVRDGDVVVIRAGDAPTAHSDVGDAA